MNRVSKWHIQEESGEREREETYEHSFDVPVP